MLTQKQQKQAAKAFYQHWKDKQGYEKGETQAFWNMLLRDIFGVAKTEDIIEYEKTVQSKSRNFIDAYIAPTKILIEQKSADKDLLKPAKQSDGSMLTPYQQAKRYADELPHSQKPRYIIACNFREFHIHDMERPQDAPQIVLLKDLQKEYHRLSFIIDNHSNAHIQKEVELSIEAGKIVGLLYDAIARQYKDMSNPKSIESLNKLCVRLVFCLYAEDTDIFHAKDAFRDYLLNHTPQSMRQALIDLFTVLNTPQNLRQNLYLSDDCLQFPYANGGLFTGDIEIPLMNDEIYRLITTTACEFDWSEISPTIFGAVFESTLNPETRRSGGMHYTSIENIYKVIKPLFLDDLIDELDDIKKLVDKHAIKRRVTDYQRKLSSLTFLDPAAGSGNFLTQTYIELRKLENQALHFAYGKQINWLDPIQVKIGQFYGIEINDFAVSVAQTALWIAEIQMKRETEEIFTDSQIEYLPLKSFAHFYEGNALRLDWNSVIPASELNYIMGNPPFVGASMMTAEQKNDTVRLFGKIHLSNSIDYVAGWYYKACEMMSINPNIRATLVSTNSITQGEQVAALWGKLFEFGIEIDYAYRTFRWDSESNDTAKVHCVIIGFSLRRVGLRPTTMPQGIEDNNNFRQPENQPAVGWVTLRSNPPTTPTGVDNANNFRQPEMGNIAPIGANGGSKTHPTTETTTAVGWASQPTNNAAGVDNADNFRQPEMGNIIPIGANGGLERSVTHPTTEQSMTENLSGSLKKAKIIYDGNQQITAKNINQYLLDAPMVFIESNKYPICNNVSLMSFGSMPRDGSGFILSEEEKDEFIQKDPKTEKWIRLYLGAEEFINNKKRYCLWLVNATPADIRQSPQILKRVEQVREFRLKSKAESTRKLAEKPTLFAQITQPESNYLMFPRVSSEKRQYIPIGYLDKEIIASDACFTVANATLYEFGVLTSSVHNAWMRAVAGRLKSDYRYSKDIVYNNFIWCEPDTAQKAKIEHTARAILDARANYPESSLADLYDELTMPPDLRAAHKANDTAVLTAYGLPKTITEEEIVAFLMQEYQKRTSKN